jgi:EpsI family protein
MSLEDMRTRVLVVFAGLLVAAGAVSRVNRPEEPPHRTSFASFPGEIGDWRGVENPPLSQDVRDQLRADDYLTRTYSAGEHDVVGLYVGYWASQRQGDAIHSPLNCLPGAGWEYVAKQPLTFPDPRQPGGPTATINRDVVQKGLDQMLVLYWYQSHSRIVASEYWSKFYLVKDAVRLNRTDGAIVRVMTPIAGTSPGASTQAEQRAMRFVNLLLPKLHGFLPD